MCKNIAAPSPLNEYVLGGGLLAGTVTDTYRTLQSGPSPTVREQRKARSAWPIRSETYEPGPALR